MLRVLEPRDGLNLRRDEERPVGADARNGLEQLDGGYPTADVADLRVQALDHHAELINEAFMGLDQEALLRTEQGPGLGVDPGSSLACVETAAWQGDADAVQLGVDTAKRGGSVAHQARAVTHEGGLLTLCDGLGKDLWDETHEPHACEELSVDGVGLVAGFGDGAQPLRVSQDDVNVRAIESVEEPRPHAAGLNDDLEWLVALEQFDESVGLAVADPTWLLENGSSVAHDRDHKIRCV